MSTSVKIKVSTNISVGCVMDRSGSPEISAPWRGQRTQGRWAGSDSRSTKVPENRDSLTYQALTSAAWD